MSCLIGQQYYFNAVLCFSFYLVKYYLKHTVKAVKVLAFLTLEHVSSERVAFGRKAANWMQTTAHFSATLGHLKEEPSAQW